MGQLKRMVFMKIVSVEAIPYDLPTVRPHRLAMATIELWSEFGDGMTG
jgi:hypothetical protein